MPLLSGSHEREPLKRGLRIKKLLYFAAHGFLAAQGFFAAHGFFAAQGLTAFFVFIPFFLLIFLSFFEHGFFAAHGFLTVHGFFAAQGFFTAHGLPSFANRTPSAGSTAKAIAVKAKKVITASKTPNLFFIMFIMVKLSF
ncbi:MAG: hypothetical protein HY884_09885 [Deltaproteobacteria bacterium]|nr:hypothetical protein [Deltaproteobacteria bacterium]